MKKSLLIVLGVVLVIAAYVMNLYNGLINLDESIMTLQAQVDNMYDRRADLIPQVAAVVKKAAEFEKNTYGDVAKFRGPAGQIAQLQQMVASGDIKSDQFAALLASTMGAMKIGAEAYPDLKANEQFSNLFVTIEGSENRIRTSIMDYNNAIIDFNTRIRRFPANLLANMLGYEIRERITPPADKDIKAVPNVESML